MGLKTEINTYKILLESRMKYGVKTLRIHEAREEIDIIHKTFSRRIFCPQMHD
jgi:hypothetical protein